ncbi:PAC2 family [Bifidobacterium samirii]|uniref:PAC2 family n=2 Tax=Bifidobacterium samirii TaxID=2306974 RepID=A0A430FJI1_9BIFI|nr:PAC2 family [Bifidobacterium samirii]
MLIAAFGGWNDACQAATDAVRHLTSRYPSREVRTIDGDGFYDYQATRPIVCYATGRRRIVWPQTTVYDVELPQGRHLYALIAPEPNYRWPAYCAQVLRIADELDVRRIVTLGAMFADCPHTRPLPLDVEDGSAEAVTDPDQRYSGPVGIPTILDAAAVDEGFATSSIWASIPQYLEGDDCAAATLRLLDAIGDVAGVPIDAGDLPGRAGAWREAADVLASTDEALAAYVKRLEREYDAHEKARREASLGGHACRQLVMEAEAFLHSLETGHDADGDGRGPVGGVGTTHDGTV